jgi:hypothetical protein
VIQPGDVSRSVRQPFPGRADRAGAGAGGATPLCRNRFRHRDRTPQRPFPPSGASRYPRRPVHPCPRLSTGVSSYGVGSCADSGSSRPPTHLVIMLGVIVLIGFILFCMGVDRAESFILFFGGCEPDRAHPGLRRPRAAGPVRDRPVWPGSTPWQWRPPWSTAGARLDGRGAQATNCCAIAARRSTDRSAGGERHASSIQVIVSRSPELMTLCLSLCICKMVCRELYSFA